MISLNKINFFCIGAQKSGTSTLFQLLKQHPDVYIPANKEAHFFDRDFIYSNGIEWYLKKYYSNWQGQKMVGSVTPSYLYADKVPGRIKSIFNKELKFIVILRNPIDRAFSSYLMNVSNGNEKYNFELAIQNEVERIKKSEQADILYSYIKRGYYFEQLNRYFKKFNSKNFLILTFEKDVIAQPQEMMKKVCEFLSIEEFQFNYAIKKNEFKPPLNVLEKGIKKIHRLAAKTGLVEDTFGKRQALFIKKQEKPMLQKNRREELLHHYFIDDIEKLSLLLNMDFKEIWK
ncbi:MAG: sulfotransferase [Bacteroidetes bacterium]|nr:MAG: sulfotransferase [Bacteroidota bacterium]MBL1144026.1 sulfotransferase [Bacteroidota bacterium]NOG56826.1 sulfotransferase [Bacteroidota bacterium]